MDQQSLERIGAEMAAAMTSSFDRGLKEVLAVALAQRVAPNPQLAALENKFAASVERVNALEGQLQIASGGFQQDKTAIAAIGDELGKARAE